MAAHALASLPKASSPPFYLDTSAVIPIAAERAGSLKAGSRDARCLAALKAFIPRAHSAGVRVKTSILALEEIAAKTRNAGLRDQAAAKRHGSWRDFRLADPAGSDVALAIVHKAMLKQLEDTAQGLGALGVA